MSAAALVLVSGKERLVAKKAKVGFHAGRLPGMTFYQRLVIEKLDRETMRSAGISEEFISRVLATPSNEMWYPTSDEMFKAHAITAVF